MTWKRWASGWAVLPLSLAGALALTAGTTVARDSVGPLPAPESGSYLAGRYAQHIDDWAAAAQFLGNALARDPDDVSLLHRTFVLELGDGHYPAALELAQRIIAKDATSPLAVLVLVVDDVLAGRLDQADSRLRSLTPEGISRYSVPLLGSWLALARGQPKAVIEAALAPLDATQGLGVLTALHRAMLADVSGDNAAAAASYTEAVAGNPTTLRVIQTAGSFLQRTGHTDQAQALFAAFARDNLNGGLLDRAALIEQADLGATPAVVSARDGLAEALFDLTSALHQEGSDELALVYAQLALQLRPNFALIQLLLGDILVSRNHPAEALAHFQAIRDDRALGWTARLRASDTLAALERKDEAVALLEAMAAERPERADPLVRLGELYRADKKYPAAIAAYDRALARIPKLDERHWTIIYGRAACYERTGPWEKSEHDLLDALELSKEQAVLLNFLGYSWADKGLNLPRARAMIERAVSLRPKDGYIIDSLGWVLFRQGDIKGAVVQLERAIELKPADATINDHLGDIYWAIGRQTEAVFQWRRAVQYSDDDELTRAVRKKLQDHDRPAGAL